MAISQNIFKPGETEVNIKLSDKVKITNLSVSPVDTEVSHSFATNVQQVVVRSRALVEVKIAFEFGESGTNYITLKPGAVLTLSGLDFSSKTLYTQGSVVTTLEILEFYF